MKYFSKNFSGRTSLFFRKKESFRSGMSMLEIVVTMAVFSIIMVSTVDIFANMTQTRMKFDKIRKNHENAQIALDSLAKSVRSGTLVNIITGGGGDASAIRIYDYSQKLCVEYMLDNGADKSFKMKRKTSERDECKVDTNLGSAITLVSDVTIGRFDVGPDTVSGGGSSPPANYSNYTTLFVRIRMILPSYDAQNTRIQTAVSMRNME
ncbi:MAG: type II secretion system protein [Candidatus Moraniibacteriota bacterium]|nr:MAG: type II secretion system protein [Candidatus Moranbacteria bacterium]